MSPRSSATSSRSRTSTSSIPTGQLTALLGPSGGGKSTLLRIIAGLDTADSGTISIEGTNATKLPPQKRNVGFVFQHYAVFKHMTVAKNVAFGLEIRKKKSKAEIAERVDELLKLVHLSQFAHRLPSQLSGGQRQRMALARALAVEPTVLLLDEPFGALDAKVRKELREWLRRLHDEVNVTTVFVTHDQEEALEVADEIVVINEGRVEQIGSPDELYDEPANDFVMGFLGEVTTLNGHLIRPHDIDIATSPLLAGAVQGEIARMLRIGFEVRVTVLTDDGQEVTVTLTRTHARALGIEEGQHVWLSPAGRRPHGADDAGGLSAPGTRTYGGGLPAVRPSACSRSAAGGLDQPVVDLAPHRLVDVPGPARGRWRPPSSPRARVAARPGWWCRGPAASGRPRGSRRRSHRGRRARWRRRSPRGPRSNIWCCVGLTRPDSTSGCGASIDTISASSGSSASTASTLACCSSSTSDRLFDAEVGGARGGRHHPGGHRRDRDGAREAGDHGPSDQAHAEQAHRQHEEGVRPAVEGAQAPDRTP